MVCCAVFAEGIPISTLAQIRTRIKFCGFTDPTDLGDAVALGVDAVGFVFYSRSPRFVEPAQAALLRRALPSWIAVVGLFVDADPMQVRGTAGQVGLDVIQFHGDEDASACAASVPGGARWWRAVRMKSPAVLLDSFARFRAAEALLLDSFSPVYGGSGAGFDWNWIPPDRPMPIILSGGLKPDNVAQAIASVRPLAVDVSSGIQSEDPRRKDRGRMERFVAEVLRTDAQLCRMAN
jgi:phosphoribosylanthranilate isomerase